MRAAHEPTRSVVVQGPEQLAELLFGGRAWGRLELPLNITSKHAFLFLADVYVRGLAALQVGPGAAASALDVGALTPGLLEEAAARMRRAGVEARVELGAVELGAEPGAAAVLDLHTGVLALPEDGLPLAAYSAALRAPWGSARVRFACLPCGAVSTR